MRDYARFDAFLSSLTGDIYPEAPSEPHLTITRTIIEQLHTDGLLRPGARVLDIGCGQGLALAQFRRLGIDAVGVTLGPDYDVCRTQGFYVRQMDQNFMSFADAEFDFLWCRHVLEHSAAPLFTLSEYRRVVKPNGLVYVEVPAPETSAHHETNANHYSVFPSACWLQLFSRARLLVQSSLELSFAVPCGPDRYLSYLLRRPET
jgi:SAM-dependent methyltransferase